MRVELSRRSKSLRRSRPLLECLESRRLMTDVPLYAVSPDGVLSIHGTDGPDKVSVTKPQGEPGLWIGVNDVFTSVPPPVAAGVRRIDIDGGAGNDTLLVDVDIPASILGGDGNDSLTGGSADDTLVGGDGDDTLMGTRGHDLLDAGGGANVVHDGRSVNVRGLVAELADDGTLTIHGTPGDDQIRFYTPTVYAGPGYIDNPGFWLDGFQTGIGGIRIRRIVIDAGDGNDVVDLSGGGWQGRPFLGCFLPATLSGGDGDDLLVGAAADDVIHGGDGNDTLAGGFGNDTLAGDAGDDVIFGGMGHDALLGGSGTDPLYGDPSQDNTGDETEDAIQSVAWVDDDGILQIRGTPGGDVITVNVSIGQTASIPPHFFGGVEVFVDGEAASFSFGEVKGVNVLAGAGADRVRIDGSLGQYAGATMPDGWPTVSSDPFPVVIDGGDGNDQIMHPPSQYDRTTLIGGAGDDTLNGDAGVDYLDIPAMPDGVVKLPWGDNPVPVTPVPIPSPPVMSTSEPAPGNMPDPTAPDPTEGRPLVSDAPTGRNVKQAGKRIVMGGGATAVRWKNGVLVVHGTDGDDVIRVTRAVNGKRANLLVRVNDVTRAFRVGKAIRRVRIDAGDGDDSVLLGGSGVAGSVFADAPLDVPAVVSGGSGDDTIVGGAKADVIRGGGGRDSIRGGGGDDLLDGGAGVDSVAGGAGEDRAVRRGKVKDLISAVERAV